MKHALWIVICLISIVFSQSKEAADAYNSGVDSYTKTKYAEALKSFKKAIDLDPKFSKAYFMKALTQKALNDTKSAIETLKECVKVDTAYAKAWEALGKFQNTQKQTMDAQRAFQKAVSLDPRLGDSFNELGKIYYDYGNFVKAADAFQHAAQLGIKKQGEAYLYWGISCNQFGDFETAITALDKAVKMVKSSEAYYQLGHAYVHTKKYSEAITAGNQSIKLSKKEAGKVYIEVLGEAYEGLGQKDKAKEAYSAALDYKDWKDIAKKKIDSIK